MSNYGDRWMLYTKGDEVRLCKTGEFGIIVDVDEINDIYTVDVNGTEYLAAEEDLS